MKKTMKRNYITPRIEDIAVTEQDLICSSLKKSEDDADSDYDVLSRPQYNDNDWDDLEEEEF